MIGEGISCVEGLQKCRVGKQIFVALEAVGNIVPIRVRSLNESLWSYIEVYLSKSIHKFETVLLRPEGDISVRFYGCYQFFMGLKALFLALPVILITW